MGAQVLREKFATIRGRRFFSIMADEGTDISNLEKLSFCARTVHDDLNVDKDFLGFYGIDNIKSETVVKAIKVKHTMGPVTWWENIPVFLPKTVKSKQKQLQHIAKAIR